MFIPDWLNELNFAFSNRQAGQMSFKHGDVATVVRNRERFLNQHNLSLNKVVAGELVHSAGVAIVDSTYAGRGAWRTDWVPGVDALVTNDPDILLLTTHADCAPVIIYDPIHKVIGQAHAGWRGLLAGILDKTVEAVRSFNGIDPSVLKAWIGPTVGPCCYPVGLDVASLFPAECRNLVAGEEHLNLVRFIQIKLERLGFTACEVDLAGVCTSCDQRFSSLRRDGINTSAMALVSGLKANGHI